MEEIQVLEGERRRDVTLLLTRVPPLATNARVPRSPLKLQPNARVPPLPAKTATQRPRPPLPAKTAP